MNTARRPADATRVRGLRANSFAATMILLVEYGLGIWVNLYGHLPASDHGAGFPSDFARAVTDGPVGLGFHALLGVVLIVSAGVALVRSVLVGRASLIAPTTIGLVAIVVAAWSGVSFVGNGDRASSMAMAVATAVAIGAYTLVLLISGGTRAPVQPERTTTEPS